MEDYGVLLLLQKVSFPFQHQSVVVVESEHEVLVPLVILPFKVRDLV